MVLEALQRLIGGRGRVIRGGARSGGVAGGLSWRSSSIALADGKWHRRENVAAAAQGDTPILTDGATFVTLNKTGTRAWQLLGQPRSIDELAQILAAEYDAPLEVVRNDIDRTRF